MIYHKAVSVAHMNPGEWAYVQVGDTSMLIVSCASCFQQSTIEKSTVNFDGTFVGGRCPYLNCRGDLVGTLDDWTP